MFRSIVSINPSEGARGVVGARRRGSHAMRWSWLRRDAATLPNTKTAPAAGFFIQYFIQLVSVTCPGEPAASWGPRVATVLRSSRSRESTAYTPAEICRQSMGRQSWQTSSREHPSEPRPSDWAARAFQGTLIIYYSRFASRTLCCVLDAYISRRAEEESGEDDV